MSTENQTPAGPSGNTPENDQTQGPVSQVQIDALNASRPRPEFATHYRPEGSVTEEKNRQENDRRNAEIDQQIENFRQRMAVRKDDAREAMNVAAKYKGERNI